MHEVLTMISQERELAWTLSETVSMGLPPDDRHHVFIALGLGDSFNAIALMVQLAVSRDIALPTYLIAAVEHWLRAYLGSPEATHLADLLQVIDVAQTRDRRE